VLVFCGAAAYDTQKLKSMALAHPEGMDPGIVRKGAISGALSLYLDFLNLFLMLLRIFASVRD
jgi:FtsH-binding integral membrane protein